MASEGKRLVYLVGAGPGDPELLTLKAHRLLSDADVVVYDRLVGEGVLDLIPAGTTRICVGKESGRHLMAQDEINELLLGLAKPGRRVVRLKGGDPFVFGRGGEEALHLVRHGVAVEVVPGVTAASGCSAAAGIPLTHRGLATGVRLVTGHARDDGALELDWDSLADPDCTLVIYMGLATIGTVAGRLMAAGLPASTPAAAIENGTTTEQRARVTTLGRLAVDVAAWKLRAPTLLMIGKVVSLAAELGRADTDAVAEAGNG
jgi:uroporphyrin-III C-methyltransferase/precorrin-2 dehydrogenase/sirohydrochlorin ferrochelatase/uroporphyrin-III C-methyltransferase